MTPKYSVVIPTYNHCDDLLKPCLESIMKYTDLSNVEVIVVANGCVDNTREYVNSLHDVQPSIKLVWMEEAAGYTKATNVGISTAIGEYVVLLNNDTVLLEQSQNQWLQMLEAPFLEKQSVGLTGPLKLHDDYANYPVLIFFCVMVKRELFQKIGFLDEVFSPGGGEDIDFSIRAEQAGYSAEICAGGVHGDKMNPNVGNFPIWHKENETFKNIPEYTNYIVKRNGLINCLRYNKNIKLNLGAGGIEYPGYLSVDLHDKRAHVLLDITQIETQFKENSVDEILASHVFEHLNPYHVFDILTKWFKVLKPGAKLVMEMPNIEELCRRFVTASKSERYGILNAVYGSVNTTNVGGPDVITSPHLFGWWPEALWDTLMGVGFRNVEFMAEKIPHPESNLRVECIKPLTANAPIFNHDSYEAQEPITYKEIFVDNEYDIQPDEVKDRTIVDIGANLGFFSLKCLESGALQTVAVEAIPVICEQGLAPNVAGHPVTIVNRAALDVDDKIVMMVNEHVASRIKSDAPNSVPVKTISLKTIVHEYLPGLSLPDSLNNDLDPLLKLDCEGSEFEILLNSDDDLIRTFKIIYLELHANTNEKPEYQNIDILRDRLESLEYERVSIGNALEDNCAIEKWVRNDE